MMYDRNLDAVCQDRKLSMQRENCQPYRFVFGLKPWACLGEPPTKVWNAKVICRNQGMNGMSCLYILINPYNVFLDLILTSRFLDY